MREYSLFSSGHWHEFSDNRIVKAVNEATRLTKDRFDSNSKEQIVEHITSMYALEPLNLRVDEKDQDLVETKNRSTGGFVRAQPFSDTDIPTYTATVDIPYSGTEILFDIQPSKHTLHHFSAQVFGGMLSFSKEFPQGSATAEFIKETMDREIALYRTEINCLNSDLAGFNRKLEDIVRSTVESRYQQISKLDSIKTALKIPLEKTSSPSPLNQIKVKVKKIAPLSTKKEEPGAYISDGDYEHIIDSMRSAGASMEASRASEFQDEETLRDVMLVVLSGAITNGVAGGELFHKKGKTDISIPFENKATFVAECKLWKGQKYVAEGIDQLLGYTTWRDAKTSLVIFNKDNANFSAIQSQIEAMFTCHRNYVKTIKQRDGEWRFTLTKPDDPGRQIQIHVLLFDLYDGVH